MRRSSLTSTFVATVAAVIVAVAALGACSSDKSSSSSKPPVNLGGTVTDKGTKTVSGSSIEVEADDLYFKPTFIEAKPGATITLELKNEGKAAHTFTSDQLHVDQMLNPEQSASVKVTVPASGFVEFHCKFHGSLGMRGAIVASS